MAIDIFNRLADRPDLLGFLVGNLAFELFFKSHNQFYQIQRVRLQIFAKARLRDDSIFVNAK